MGHGLSLVRKEGTFQQVHRVKRPQPVPQRRWEVPTHFFQSHQQWPASFFCVVR